MGVVTEGYMRSWSMFIMAMVLISGRMILHTRKLLLEERNLAQQSKIKLLEENYRHAIELYKEKAILLHDQRNHIQIINEYIRKGETEKALHYGECINKKLDGIRNRIWSNHQTIDMVLNMKAQEARDNNIEIDFRFEDMSDLAMEETDICALLFNLLDNAIEANLKIESIEKRWIKLSGTKQGCMLFINSTNPIGERLQREGERLLTTKVDKRNHGFGMESVKQIIDKYQGVVKIEEEEDVFFLDLVMMAISAN